MKKLGAALALVAFSVALWVLHRQLQQHSLAEIGAAVSAIPAARLLLGLGLTALSYLVLSGYDALALRWQGRSLPYRRVLLASGTGYALSQGVGLSLLTAVPARFRLYSRWGLSSVEISEIVIFCIASFWIGALLASGVAFLLVPGPVSVGTGVSPALVRVLGAVLMAVVAAYFAWTLRGTRVEIRGWELRPPRPALAAGQLALALVDWVVAAGVLYALLPRDAAIAFLPFLGIFVVAQVVGLASHVPGGLGVLEAGFVLLLGDSVPRPELLASLVAYRAVYYLVPLAVAMVAFLASEADRVREPALRVGGRIGRWALSAVPVALASTTFVAGAVLLASGATPAVPDRLAWLDRLLPLPVIELTHFLASLAGAALLLLAWGLARRLDGAWVLSVALLAAGAVFSLTKGLDYEEAVLLTVMLLLLLPARRHFYRRTSMLREPFSLSWLVAIGLVLLGSLWLGFFAYRHVAYSGELWWRFTLTGDAPRFLRATVGAVVLIAGVGAVRLLRPASPLPTPPGKEEIERAAGVVSASPRAASALALLGDKQFHWTDAGDAFVMYGVAGRSWVVMGDPVGPREAWAEAVWGFRELVDRYDGWPVFYQVSPEALDLCLDMGLSLVKLGEEARVDLGAFSLEGGRRKALRRARGLPEREGCRFEVVPPSGVTELLPELRRVSDEWMQARNAREKGFSLGSFQESYLSRFPVALLRRDNRVLAFANLWESGGRREVAPDLMRHRADAPNGAMESLFVHMILWAQEREFRWLNLGMAPLSGLESRRLAPVWHRAGSLVFRFGDQFYSFEGLRRFKEKFDPVWEPRYLASPGGLALPRVLSSVATLVSGGLGGVFSR